MFMPLLGRPGGSRASFRPSVAGAPLRAGPAGASWIGNRQEPVPARRGRVTVTRQISVDVPCLRVPSPVLARSCEWPGSGGAVADHPDCGGAEQHREGEQPAALDELEGPEAAGRLVGEVLDIALLCEPLLNGLGGRQAACLAELAAQAGDFGLAGGRAAGLDP